MANMKDIARIAGVSLGTVSHVLNETAVFVNRCVSAYCKRCRQPATSRANLPARCDATKPT